MLEQQVFAQIIARVRQADPTFGDAFLRRVRIPRWRYFAAGNRIFCWSVEPATDTKGRRRYASWVARIQKNRTIAPIRGTRREHAKRKDAKARALAMWEAA